MAFIRNKNGIFKLIEQKGDIGFVTVDDKHYFYERIDQKARSIRELCDEFVVQKFFDGKVDAHRYYTLQDALEKAEWHEAVYGGFWIPGKGFFFKAIYDDDKKDLVLLHD